MTRRLTITSAEMGDLVDRPDLHLLPSAGGEVTPFKQDTFWRRPSKWQICMPRLRFFAKVVGFVIFTGLCLKILTQGPPKPPSSGPITPAQPHERPEENFRDPTEAEMIERSKMEDWIWKDFNM